MQFSGFPCIHKVAVIIHSRTSLSPPKEVTPPAPLETTNLKVCLLWPHQLKSRFLFWPLNNGSQTTSLISITQQLGLFETQNLIPLPDPLSQPLWSATLCPHTQSGRPGACKVLNGLASLNCCLYNPLPSFSTGVTCSILPPGLFICCFLLWGHCWA